MQKYKRIALFLHVNYNARMTPQKRQPGRPKENGSQQTRQVGRWSEERWNEIRTAASIRGLSVAAWAKDVMLRAARKESR